MGDSTNQRRLAAILAADVAGYTQLVEQDTDGTVAAWKAARDDVIKPQVGEKSGHIIKFTGDGFLVEFPSVQDAVDCAIALQEELVSSSLNFRMGVNVGDITDDGGDVHGEGVNIAARLEALAEPGGICISGDVYNQVRNRIDADFRDMGKQEVKHVSQPVQIYAIRVSERSAPENPTSELPDKPSIAILPFDNMSGDPEQEYFSDGITEDIITELARFQWLTVIARNSSFAFKGQAADITEVGKKLGVHYVVEGSVRKAGNRVRITAQLIEAKSGSHLWAERFDRELEDIFAVQDEVVSNIAMMVSGHVDVAYMDRLGRTPTTNFRAYDLALQAQQLAYNAISTNMAESVQLLEKAIEIDPEYAAAHAYLAQHSAWRIFHHGHEIDDAKRITRKHGETATRLCRNDGLVNAVLAESYGMVGEHKLAAHHADVAMSLNPNAFFVIAFIGWVKACQGDHEGANTLLDKAMCNDPYSNISFRESRIEVYYMAQRYEECVATLIGWPDPPLHVELVVAAALAQLDRNDEANAALRRIIAAAPEGWNLVNVCLGYENMCARREDGEHWLEGFRKAGIDV